jgi:hypothetical protein
MLVMKKGIQIYLVTIDHGIVKALDDQHHPIPLTRSQRQTLMRYKQKDYIANINKEWHNKNVIHHNFAVAVDGEIVFTYTK